MNQSLINRLREFMEDEARSGSMDFGCITPEYVYRMWGGSVPMEDIENGLMELRKMDDGIASLEIIQKSV